jgi:hypothetical protein
LATYRTFWTAHRDRLESHLDQTRRQ